MIDRLETRQAIAKEIADARAAREHVNVIPEVASARAKMEAAHLAYGEAQAELRKAFNKHYVTDNALQEKLYEKYPDLYQHGDVDSDCKWIVCCCVTGLPIFNGDRVYEYRVGDELYERFLVLADAVTVVPEFAREAIPAGDDASEYEDAAQ